MGDLFNRRGSNSNSSQINSASRRVGSGEPRRGSFNGNPSQRSQPTQSQDLRHRARHQMSTTPTNFQKGQIYTKLIDDTQTRNYNTQLSINMPFASNEFAQQFSVCNPKKAQTGDHIVYTVVGTDSFGRFEVARRYKEFYLLRNRLASRYPGFYVPPIPPKRSTGNTNADFIEARCFYLNMFWK